MLASMWIAVLDGAGAKNPHCHCHASSAQAGKDYAFSFCWVDWIFYVMDRDDNDDGSVLCVHINIRRNAEDGWLDREMVMACFK